MAGIVASIKDVLAIKIKLRHDSYSDQYCRIFMMKLLLIGTFIIGLNWYSDKITCITTDDVEFSKDYISDACWIQGFYVYPDVKAEKDTVAYDGIPTNLDYDGKDSDDKLCIHNPPRQQVTDDDCKPLKKVFYLQYQYMMFFVATLSLLYYLPYVIFQMLNADIFGLKHNVKCSDLDNILQSYFNYAVNSRVKMRLRVVSNIVIKMLYVSVNICAFLFMDNVLDGRYVEFGSSWLAWSNVRSDIAHDYTGAKIGPKPGSRLLPPFGICEIHEGARNARSTITDKHKFICEFSQHILYHYVLLVLWFAFIIGIVASIVGLLVHISDIMLALCLTKHDCSTKEVFREITLREHEYLEYIRRKNLVLYEKLLEKIKEERCHKQHVNGVKMNSLPNGMKV